VPLIVIIVVTAVKDGIEDWRRTVLDNELNNAPVHRLVDWQNVNTADEIINPWRKFKKANTRAILWVWQQWKDWKANKGKKSDKGKGYADRALDRSPTDPAQDDRRYSVWSRALDDDEEPVGENENGEMEMTPVPSPTPNQKGDAGKEYFENGEMVNELNNDAAKPGDARQRLSVPPPGKAAAQKTPVLKKFYGSLVDYTQDAPETARFKKEYWKSVQVGDFVRLYNEEEIPADIIVLSTSDSDGACYVETKNLDGETNLKVRQALHTGRKVKRARDCERTNFRLESEPPHANLYSYSGAVRWLQKDAANPDQPPKEMAEPVGINNMLLRGCTLRNTDWVVGIVAFTGEETKIMLNSGITPTKRAQISKDLNVNVLYNFASLQAGVNDTVCTLAEQNDFAIWHAHDSTHTLSCRVELQCVQYSVLGLDAMLVDDNAAIVWTAHATLNPTSLAVATSAASSGDCALNSIFGGSPGVRSVMTVWQSANASMKRSLASF